MTNFLLNRSISKHRRYLSLSLLCLVIFSAPPMVAAEASISKSHKIMAAFLLRFASYTQWPVTTPEKINLCILGDAPFTRFINTMAKNRPTNASGKKIQIKEVDTAKIITDCHILYSAQNETKDLWPVLPKNHSILLVSESSEFLSQGGMINFVLKEKRIKLEVNLTTVNNAQLKISSQLLKHATVITQPTEKVDS